MSRKKKRAKRTIKLSEQELAWRTAKGHPLDGISRFVWARRDRARKYGLTLNQVEARLRAINANCEACKKGRILYFDHNHSTGEFRGFLCSSCNTGIGNFGCDVDRMKAAIEYLEKYPPIVEVSPPDEVEIEITTRRYVYRRRSKHDWLLRM
jgi:hypothetical protein